jgi:hypothetical protein
MEEKEIMQILANASRGALPGFVSIQIGTVNTVNVNLCPVRPCSQPTDKPTYQPKCASGCTMTGVESD